MNAAASGGSRNVERAGRAGRRAAFCAAPTAAPRWCGGPPARGLCASRGARAAPGPTAARARPRRLVACDAAPPAAGDDAPSAADAAPSAAGDAASSAAGDATPSAASAPRADNAEMQPMRWGRIPEGQECTYCEGKEVVECPVCDGAGFLGRTITCRYCQGRKRLACPLCVEDDPYAWSYSGVEVDVEGPESGEDDAVLGIATEAGDEDKPQRQAL